MNHAQQLTLEDGAAARDAAMQRVEAAAEKIAPEFPGEAYAMLSLFVAHHSGTFVADDVLRFARERGVIAPKGEERAWGPIFMKAKRRGLIAFVGWEDSPKRHNSPGRVWRKVVV